MKNFGGKIPPTQATPGSGDPTKRLLQKGADGVVSGLCLEVGIEEEGVLALPPAVLVADTPDGDTDAVLGVQASTDGSLVIVGRGTLDIELRHGALASDSAKSLERLGDIRDGPGAAQVRLGANAVDGDAGGDPLLDLGDHTLGLCVVGGVEVVVVDVELGLGVGGAGGLEGGGDEAFTEDVVEDGGAEAAILGEDLVDDVLGGALVNSLKTMVSSRDVMSKGRGI